MPPPLSIPATLAVTPRRRASRRLSFPLRISPGTNWSLALLVLLCTFSIACYLLNSFELSHPRSDLRRSLPQVLTTFITGQREGSLVPSQAEQYMHWQKGGNSILLTWHAIRRLSVLLYPL